MSQGNYQTKSTGPKMPVITLDSKVKLHIPLKVSKLITFFCQTIKKDEWSGILFYEVKGSIKNPKKMKVICHDIYLMDRGTPGYTTFKTDASITTYMMKNPHLLDMKMGLIHSHNTMNVFFSGEDWDELHKTNGQYNFYLSLIINNFNEYCAKIAFTGRHKQVITPYYQCQDEKGDFYRIKGEPVEAISERMFVLDCEITSDLVAPIIDQKYVDRFQLIDAEWQKEKAAAEARRTAYTKPAATPQPHIPHNRSMIPSSGNGGGGAIIGNEWAEAFAVSMKPDEESLSIDEEFTCFCLLLGNARTTENTVEDCFETLEATGIDQKSFAENISQSFASYYEQFYDVAPDSYSVNKYLEAIEDFISIIELEDEETYPVITTLSSIMKEHGARVEASLSTIN